MTKPNIERTVDLDEDTKCHKRPLIAYLGSGYPKTAEYKDPKLGLIIGPSDKWEMCDTGYNTFCANGFVGGDYAPPNPTVNIQPFESSLLMTAHENNHSNATQRFNHTGAAEGKNLTK
jgi:hypothetical protein